MHKFLHKDPCLVCQAVDQLILVKELTEFKVCRLLLAEHDFTRLHEYISRYHNPCTKYTLHVYASRVVIDVYTLEYTLEARRRSYVGHIVKQTVQQEKRNE